MNWLLICVIGILVVCALEGYFRGFIKIVFSLLAMIITLAVVSVAAPKITTYIEENTELDERITEKCLEHVEKNAQDRLDREAQEKSEETRQQLEENGISGGELDALMDKAAEAGSDAVHQALADSGVYQAMAQKITHFIISLIACHSDICGGISSSSYYFECAGSGGEASGSERNQPVHGNVGRRCERISYSLGSILSDTYYGSHRMGHAAGDIYQRK